MTNEEIIGKRLIGIDFGLKRVGIAIADQFHITVSPKATLDFQDESFWTKLLLIIRNEQVGACVVGVPIHSNITTSSISAELQAFINRLTEVSNLPIFTYDESFSSAEAKSTMREIGRKKKNRSTKGELDKVAAAIILRDFLNQWS